MTQRTWIKVCGITRLDDAIAAAEAGVDALGFVFAESPRRVTPEEARNIIRNLPSHILRFGVFVDESPAVISRVVAASEVDRVQLHGFEEPMVRELTGTRVVSAFRARDDTVLQDIEASALDFFFLDTWRREVAGGTGERFDWTIAKRARELGRMILAGGLTADNVGDAIRDVRPFGVDVSSGVESAPGEKDPKKIRAFIDRARDADRELSRASAGA